MSIRIAHFSDLHYADATLAEVDHCFGAAIAHAIARQAEVAVITGDSTDHALPSHAPAYATLARRLRQLADHCPVLMLQGTFSHEPPGGLAVFSLLGGRHPITVAERPAQVALSATGHWQVSAGWRFDTPPPHTALLCSCVPTMNPATLVDACGAAGVHAAQGQQLALLLAGYAPGHRACRTLGIPTIGLSHGTVLGCVTEHGVPMAGLDHAFSASELFAAEASAFLLGHIHRHQAWTDGPRLAAYPGSIGRLHHGEQGDKGFLLWEVDAEGARFELVPTPARRMLDLRFDGAPDLDTIAAFAREQELAGAWVRVRWSVPEEERDQVDREAIAALLREAADVKLEGRVLPVTRSRAPGIAQEATIAAQLRRWAETAGVVPAPLLTRLAELERHDPETIAATVLAAMVSVHGDPGLDGASTLPQAASA